MYIPCTTCLHILLAHPCYYYYLLSLQYAVLHILFNCTFCLIFYYFYTICNFFYFIFYFICFPYLYLCIFSCVFVTYNCTVHRADLTYISLLVIFCIIIYVTNTNLESLELYTTYFSHILIFISICTFHTCTYIIVYIIYCVFAFFFTLSICILFFIICVLSLSICCTVELLSL